MTFTKDHFQDSPFSNEQTCVNYLFRKRWPWGFTCPFCRSVQQEVAPAYTVVCRHCRKQTSITARTLMHGSKKSLVGWMRVAWQFCFQYDGISARELQRLMELSCYQTAWVWLQKMRQSAALAERAPCRDIILFDLISMPVKSPSGSRASYIAMALEVGHPVRARVRFAVLGSDSAKTITAALNNLVEKNAALLIKECKRLTLNCQLAPDRCGQPTTEQLERGQLLQQKTVSWLNTVYRKAVAPSHLQGYLDEFSFRHNTASWPDRIAVLDHLLTGLLSTVEKSARSKQSTVAGGS